MDKTHLELNAESQKKIIESFAKNLTMNESSAQLGIPQELIEIQYRKIREEIRLRYVQDADFILGNDFFIGTYPQLYKDWVEDGLISEEKITNCIELFHIVEHEDRVFTIPYSLEMHNKVIEAVKKETHSDGDNPNKKVISTIFLSKFTPSCTFLDSAPKDNKNTSTKDWCLVPNWFDDKPYEGCEPVRRFCWCVHEVIMKYPSIPRSELELYMKECEFKYEYPDVIQRQEKLCDWLEV